MQLDSCKSTTFSTRVTLNEGEETDPRTVMVEHRDTIITNSTEDHKGVMKVDMNARNGTHQCEARGARYNLQVGHHLQRSNIIPSPPSLPTLTSLNSTVPSPSSLPSLAPRSVDLGGDGSRSLGRMPGSDNAVRIMDASDIIQR